MRKLVIAFLALVTVVACSGDGPTAPVSTKAPATLNGSGNGNGYAYGSTNGYSGLPGERRLGAADTDKFTPLNCSPRFESRGSAWIGPAGGILRIGNHRLIVPAGALTRKVFISGTVPQGKPFQIDLQPHGLQFRKAAGLILDASSCVDVPTIVYLIDQVTVSDPIPAVYSNWWKAIACPIWHFSGYSIAFHSEEDGAGAE